MKSAAGCGSAAGVAGRRALGDTLRLADVPSDSRIIPAIGETSPQDGFDYLAAIALADHLGLPVQRFPGGHNGNLTHPRAFAQRVRELMPPS